METRIIDSREDFAQWAIDQANAILVDQGSALATVARSGNDVEIGVAAHVLGQAIVDALLDAFDGLAGSE